MTLSIDPNEFLRGESLAPAAIEARYPNAKRVLEGCLFISHSGKNFERIREVVVNPFIYDRFLDGFFLHNQGSGGSLEYRELVRTALYYLDKFLLVVSKNSQNNTWVQAEVAIAIELRRPMVLCLFDATEPALIHRSLGSVPWYARGRRYTVDFRRSLASAQAELARVLDKLLKRWPYERSFF